MFTRISRAATVLGLLAALTAVLASSASATTWHTNRGTSGYTGAFTATTGAGTLTGATAALSCTGGTATGQLGATTFGGDTWPLAAWGTVTFTGCTIGGQAASVSCDYNLRANSYSGPTSYPALSGVTTGTIALTGPSTRPAGCSVVRLGVEICRIIGSTVPASYTNPAMSPGAGTLAIPAVTRGSGQLDAENGSGGTCPVGVGAAALTALSFNVPATAPVIWATNP